MAPAPAARDRASRPEDLRCRPREFEEVALVHQERLYLAWGLCRNQPDAEDLVQETLFRAFRRFDRFTPGTNCLAWLATILRNIFINQVTFPWQAHARGLATHVAYGVAAETALDVLDRAA